MSKMSELDADVAVAKSLEAAAREARAKHENCARKIMEAGLPLPPTHEIVARLKVLWHKLEREGQYVRANTVALAIEAIRRLEAKP